MSTLQLFGTTILHGVEIEVMSECDVRWEDDSFDHEFGTERCGHPEVETIDPVEMDLGSYTLRQIVLSQMADESHPHRRRLFLKRCRRIRRAVAALDPDKFWTEKQLDEVAHEWEPPKPDYDEDRE